MGSSNFRLASRMWAKQTASTLGSTWTLTTKFVTAAAATVAAAAAADAAAIAICSVALAALAARGG